MPKKFLRIQSSIGKASFDLGLFECDYFFNIDQKIWMQYADENGLLHTFNEKSFYVFSETKKIYEEPNPFMITDFLLWLIRRGDLRKVDLEFVEITDSWKK